MSLNQDSKTPFFPLVAALVGIAVVVTLVMLQKEKSSKKADYEDYEVENYDLIRNGTIISPA
ncbi:MAG: hypothetical protein WD077_09230 [Bacteroidia bacterium]